MLLICRRWRWHLRWSSAFLDLQYILTIPLIGGVLVLPPHFTYAHVSPVLDSFIHTLMSTCDVGCTGRCFICCESCQGVVMKGWAGPYGNCWIYYSVYNLRLHAVQCYMSMDCQMAVATPPWERQYGFPKRTTTIRARDTQHVHQYEIVNGSIGALWLKKNVYDYLLRFQCYLFLRLARSNLLCHIENVNGRNIVSQNFPFFLKTHKLG